MYCVGGVPEWFKGTVLKTVVPERVPRVRISPPPPSLTCLPAGAPADKSAKFFKLVFLPADFDDEEEVEDL